MQRGRVLFRMAFGLLFVLSQATASGQQTDLISQGAVIPWKRDVAQPDRVSPDFDEVHFANVTGHKLRGWYFPAEHASRTILVCSGNTGNISLSLPYAKLLLDGGFNVLLFDYQGFGGSEGIASVTSLCSDTEAAFDYLVQKQNVQPEQIGVFGISLGSILALMVANEKQAGAVAVEDVFIPEQELKRFGIRDDDPNVMKAMAIRVAKKMLLGRVDPIQNARNCTGPIFLMHGMNDRLLPPHGTIQVADVLRPTDRVWLIDRAGHAPETLEVNDKEYSSQINRFFQQAFSGSLPPLQPQMKFVASDNSKHRRRKSEVVVTLKGEPSGDRGRRPIQLVFTAGPKYQRVVRAMLSIGESRRYQLPFRPERLTATEFQYITPTQKRREMQTLDVDAVDVHEWVPELSTFSKHRAELIEWTQAIFKRADVARVLMGNYGMSYFWAPRYLKSFPASEAQQLLDHLKDNSQCPPEICARYARLLARLYCWPLPKGANRTTQFRNDERRIALAEAMLPLLPLDQENYFELGNASFQHQFRDAVIGDTLFRLARIRLREGQTEAAQELLRRHVRLLPKQITTNLTEERICSIMAVDDLDGRPEQKNGDSE